MSSGAGTWILKALRKALVDSAVLVEATDLSQDRRLSQSKLIILLYLLQSRIDEGCFISYASRQQSMKGSMQANIIRTTQTKEPDERERSNGSKRQGIRNEWLLHACSRNGARWCLIQPPSRLIARRMMVGLTENGQTDERRRAPERPRTVLVGWGHM